MGRKPLFPTASKQKKGGPNVVVSGVIQMENPSMPLRGRGEKGAGSPGEQESIVRSPQRDRYTTQRGERGFSRKGARKNPNGGGVIKGSPEENQERQLEVDPWEEP